MDDVRTIAKPAPLSKLPKALEEGGRNLSKVMGFLPNSVLTMAKRPELLKRAGGLIGYMWSEGLSIDTSLMSLAAYMSSFGSGCRYCQAHGAAVAERMEISEKLENVWQYETSPLFCEAERAALAFAFAAGQSPSAVEDSHYEELGKHFTEEQVLDLVAVIAIMGFLNRWNDTLGTPLEDEPERAATKVLGPRGWEIGKHAGT